MATAQSALEAAISQTATNICLKLKKDKSLAIETDPTPEYGPNDVLIHMKCTGICGSDIHVWREGQIGDLVLTEDLILGHECAGKVLAVGSNVNTGLKVGDRVAIEPQEPCGECYLCVSGNYNLCLNVDFMGMPAMPGRERPFHGSMQRYKVMKSRFVHKLPDNMSYEEGALVEVFSVAYHGIEKAGGLELGKGCVVAGCGPIGLATLMLADAAGAYPILVSDVSAERLQFAKTLVPSVMTYQVDTKASEKENAQRIRNMFGEREVDMPPYVLECTGVHFSINTCAYVTRRAGILTILGVSSKNELDGFPFMVLSFGEVQVRFINRYNASWPPVINLIASGKVDAKKLVTHHFNLDNAVDAFKTVADPKITSIKVMVEDKMEV